MKSVRLCMVWLSLGLCVWLSAVQAASLYRLSQVQVLPGAAVDLLYTLPVCVITQQNTAGESFALRQDGQQIQVLLSTIDTPCLPNTPAGPEQALDLGGFAAGVYEVQVYEFSALNAFPSDLQGIVPVARLDLRVGQGFVPVPALSTHALFGLIMIVLFTAVMVLRRQRLR